MGEFIHESVLKNESIEMLNIQPHGKYVDGTLGRAGHALEISKQLDESGLFIGFDQDMKAIEVAKDKLPENSLLIHDNFRHLKNALARHGIDQFDGLLLDLGVSSPQLDDAARGFSYHQNAKLDMRMDESAALDAFTIVNEWSYEALVKIFFKYGEEKFSKQIARRIEKSREDKPIETTVELVEIIKAGIPAAARRKGGHPAKRIFQAIRIAVNDELGSFTDVLNQAAEMVNVGGRIVVITFHSLEDRICKRAFKKWSSPKPTPKGLPFVPETFQAPFKLVTKKPILPKETEIAENRRSRSAKLRVVEKVKTWDQSFEFKEGEGQK